MKYCTAKNNKAITRRQFIQTGVMATGGLIFAPAFVRAAGKSSDGSGQPVTMMQASDLPKGKAPLPVSLAHFPDRLHAFVWRNWQLVTPERMAKAIDARTSDIIKLGKAMGLGRLPRISAEQRKRSCLTVIRRNWHLLPYEQLLKLLDWTPEQMAFTLREDDFMYIKMGSLKPQCEPLKYSPPDPATEEREREIARITGNYFPDGVCQNSDELFGFVSRLSERPSSKRGTETQKTLFSPRFCYSYFALYGDPLLDRDADPYPDGYLAQLAATGVDGVWLQGVLNKLSPFPWDEKLSARYEERLVNLRALVKRARKHGIGIYLYLNEPRSMPLSFYGTRQQLKGVVEGDYAALCTSAPEVQQYLIDAVASIAKAVPDLAGFFTITGSENLTNCWSHHKGTGCPRCGKRTAAEVIAETNGLFQQGIKKANTGAKLIAWDWGWADTWVEDIISRLPTEVALMSVSEWSVPINRGGVESKIGEYSISAIGPGPRATKHWQLARQRGLKTIAKIQAGNTWELSSVPYIPAMENVARHAANLREANVGGLMLGWTLGGYPSPNLEIVAEMAQAGQSGQVLAVDTVLEKVARRRFGLDVAPAVVMAWKKISAAFSEFPFHIGTVYKGPMNYGPSDLFWSEPTGYKSTMIGFPYDDLDGWRMVYPVEAFIGQMEKVAAGFEDAVNVLRKTVEPQKKTLNPVEQKNLAEEIDVADAAGIHFRTTANQSRFVQARDALSALKGTEGAATLLDTLEKVLKDEIELAHRLHAIQSRDSRIGFEASNQYYYVGVDLAEKILNCSDLLDRWLPAQRKKYSARS
jgi:hypothetical protein